MIVDIYENIKNGAEISAPFASVFTDFVDKLNKRYISSLFRFGLLLEFTLDRSIVPVSMTPSALSSNLGFPRSIDASRYTLETNLTGRVLTTISTIQEMDFVHNIAPEKYEQIMCMIEEDFDFEKF